MLMFKNVISFCSKLGQRKNGVQFGARYLKNYNSFIKCRNTKNLFKNLNNLYEINNSVKGKRINIGGDHSIGIATGAYTLNNFKNAKIIWVDAHADINTFSKSNSKNFHGMPLAFLTKLDRNRNLSFIKNKLSFENLLYIGIRDLDDFEKEVIEKYDIKVITTEEFNKNNFEKINEFVNNSPVHLSLDVDCLDPKYFPSTGTPVENGIEQDVLLDFIDNIKESNLVNVDLCEFNPNLGSREDIKKSVNLWNEIYNKLTF